MKRAPKVKKKLNVVGIDFTKKYVCMECGCQRDPINAKRGLLVVEIFMWCLYIFPGVIYSVWRRARKQQVCSNCRNPSVALTSSTRAMKMMRLVKTFSGSLPTVSVKQPNLSSPQRQIPGEQTQSQKPKPGFTYKPVSGKQTQPLKPTPVKKDLSNILKTSNRRGLRPKGQQGLVDFKPPNKDK